MRVMILGGGGREHALAWKLSQSPSVEEVICAPGNAGTAAVARNLALDPEDVPAVVAAVHASGVNVVVVGPEAPLVAGVGDALREVGVDVFGPSRAAAQLEGSKAFAKAFMQAHGIPTAQYERFDDAKQAEAFIRASAVPPVVKADGLAAGKGVVVPASHAEALEAVDRIMRRRELGDAGASVVLEERLVGQEVSYHVVLDGERYVALAAAQDHKRLADGDGGPNTGGMGTYSPPPVVTPDVEARIIREVVAPTLAGLRADGLPYRGVLFIGLMIDQDQPKVLEYNVRFGDPETQVLMARWQGDVWPLLAGAARGDLRGVRPEWEAPSAMCVVVAAEGYPGNYAKGRVIEGLDLAAQVEGVSVFHAGTAFQGEDAGKVGDDRVKRQVVSVGGRVLGVTARGADVDEAAERAYASVARIRMKHMQYRKDIGWHARVRPLSSTETSDA